jgi:hypothetical protein
MQAINKKTVFHETRRRAFLLPENCPFKLNVKIVLQEGCERESAVEIIQDSF